MNATGSAMNLTYNGLIIDATKGAVPTPTPKELLATRAVEASRGWLGQIVMGGEIVFETEPQEDSSAALKVVNERVHDRFKRLIVGG